MLDRTLESLVNLLKSQETLVVYDALKLLFIIAEESNHCRTLIECWMGYATRKRNGVCRRMGRLI